jgi:hypothetical protein
VFSGPRHPSWDETASDFSQSRAYILILCSRKHTEGVLDEHQEGHYHGTVTRHTDLLLGWLESPANHFPATNVLTEGSLEHVQCCLGTILVPVSKIQFNIIRK